MRHRRTLCRRVDRIGVCIDREAPRIEKLQDDLESVGRIVVNIICFEPLRQLKLALINPPPGEVRDPRYNETIVDLVKGYEAHAVAVAIEAREARSNR